MLPFLHEPLGEFSLFYRYLKSSKAKFVAVLEEERIEVTCRYQYVPGQVLSTLECLLWESTADRFSFHVE